MEYLQFWVIVEIWGLVQPYKIGLYVGECLLFINSHQESYLIYVRLNPPPQSQQANNSDVAIRRLGTDRNKGGIFNTPCIIVLGRPFEGIMYCICLTRWVWFDSQKGKRYVDTLFYTPHVSGVF